MNRIIFTYLLILLVSCSNDIEFKDVSIKLSDNLSSTYIVNFKTSSKGEANVEYWKNSEEIFSSPLFYGDSFSIPLSFLKPLSNYNFKIVTSNQSSIPYTFKTNDVPKFFPKLDLEKKNNFSFDGYLFFRTQTNPGIQFMLDDNAEIIWYSIADSTLSRPFRNTNVPVLKSGASYLSLSEKNIIEEHSFLGDTLVTIYTGKDIIHHDIMKIRYDDNLNIDKYVGLTYEYLNFNQENIDSLIGDGIVVFDSFGNKLWSWNIFDYVKPNNENYKIQEDWSHANAIDIDYDGNYLVSFRSFNQIWKIDSESGEIIWRLGDNGDFNLNEEDIFYQQHAINKINLNKYILFDNGLSDVRMTSRALEFTIDEEEEKFKLEKSVYLPDSLFTFKQGSVYLMDNENYLFTSSVNNRTIISDSSGKILWNLLSDHSFYRVYYLSKH